MRILTQAGDTCIEIGNRPITYDPGSPFEKPGAGKVFVEVFLVYEGPRAKEVFDAIIECLRETEGGIITINMD